MTEISWGQLNGIVNAHVTDDGDRRIMYDAINELSRLRLENYALTKENARLEDRLNTSTSRSAVKIAAMMELLEEADDMVQHDLECNEMRCWCGLDSWRAKVKKVLEHQE